MSMQQCSACLRRLPVTQFTARSDNGKLHAQCRKCLAEQCRQRRERFKTFGPAKGEKFTFAGLLEVWPVRMLPVKVLGTRTEIMVGDNQVGWDA